MTREIDETAREFLYNEDMNQLNAEHAGTPVPRISVVMPVFNCEKYLDEAISSMLNQTFGDFELIVVNDGSADGTDEVVRKYLGDERLVYKLNESNGGIVDALNLGLELAKADIVARMDGDDIAVPERLEIQYQFLEKNPDIVLVGSYIELIDDEGNYLSRKEFRTGPENIRKIFFYYGPHWHPTVMFRKDIVSSVGRYRKEYELIEDVDLYFRLIFAGFRTDNIPMYLLKYRIHSESSDKRFKEKGVLSLRLKREMIKEFNVRLGAVDHLSMYVHYFLDRCLSARSKHQVETLVKAIIDSKQN